MTENQESERKSMEGKLEFEKALENLINRYSMENPSNTPDFILAMYLSNCLQAFTEATQQREAWHGRDPRPSHPLSKISPASRGNEVIENQNKGENMSTEVKGYKPQTHEKKEKWAIIVHPGFLKGKSVCLMSSPYVKKDEPVWVNLSALPEIENRDFKLPFGIDATQNFIAHKVEDLHTDDDLENNQK